MSEMQNWDLGQPVVFTAKLERDKTHNGPVEWNTETCEETKGYYMGHRVVYEGTHVRGSYGRRGYGDASYLAVRGSVPHAIVVVNKRAAPTRVPYEALEERTDVVGEITEALRECYDDLREARRDDSYTPVEDTRKWGQWEQLLGRIEGGDP